MKVKLTKTYQCPNCGGCNTRFRSKTQTFFCGRCGFIWSKNDRKIINTKNKELKK